MKAYPTSVNPYRTFDLTQNYSLLLTQMVCIITTHISHWFWSQSVPLVIKLFLVYKCPCLRRSKPPPPPFHQWGVGFLLAMKLWPVSVATTGVRIQGRYQSSPTYLKVCPPPLLKSHDRKSKLFPSCGSVEQCDSRNTSVAERYNTLKHCGGGGGGAG